jgi:hypothetical protein
MVRVGNLILGDRDKRLYGITDQQIIQSFELGLELKARNAMTLVAITDKSKLTWTLDQELKEMKGHLRGLIRSRYGREMLDARKLARYENIKLGRL